MMYIREEFEKMRIESAEKMAKDSKLQEDAIDELVRADRYNWIHQTNWFGEPVLQLPQDLFALQEIIFNTRPKYIIELGVAWGGILLFYSTLMQVLGGESVIGVDIYIPDDLKQRIYSHSELSKRITLINNSSVEKKTVEQIKSMLPNLKADFLAPVLFKGQPTEDDFGMLDKLADEIASKHEAQNLI